MTRNAALSIESFNRSLEEKDVERRPCRTSSRVSISETEKRWSDDTGERQDRTNSFVRSLGSQSTTPLPASSPARELIERLKEELARPATVRSSSVATPSAPPAPSSLLRKVAERGLEARLLEPKASIFSETRLSEPAAIERRSNEDWARDNSDPVQTDSGKALHNTVEKPPPEELFQKWNEDDHADQPRNYKSPGCCR